MLEEADQNFSTSLEKIQKMDKLEAEKMIEKLKEQHEAELASLQMSLNRMIMLEKKHHEDKEAENFRKNDIRNEIQNIRNENQNLKMTLIEYQTQIAVLRSEIAELKANSGESEKDSSRQMIFHLGKETMVLRNEIIILRETNKKLNDTNDILLNEITAMKTRFNQNTSKIIFEQDICNSSTPTDRFFRKKLNDSYESDFEEDSGIWQNESIFDKKSINGEEEDLNISKTSLSPVTGDLVLTLGSTHCKSKVSFNLDNSLNIVIVGDSSVGKTSFLLKNFNSKSLNTTDNYYFKSQPILGQEEIKIQLWDTSSNQGFQCLENSTFRRADGFIIVYDVTNENSFNNIRNWVRHINETCDQRMPILIVGNKTDLRETATCNRLKFIDTRKGSLTARNNGAFFIEANVNLADGCFKEPLEHLCKAMIRNKENENKYFLYYFS